MKPFDYYSKVKVAYPYKKNYIVYYVYDKGKLLWSGQESEKTKADIKKEFPNAVIQEVLDEDEYRKHWKEYTQEYARLKAEFKADLFEDYGVSDNPKRERCYELAWDLAHSGGYSQVYDMFGDIVDLIKD